MFIVIGIWLSSRKSAGKDGKRGKTKKQARTGGAKDDMTDPAMIKARDELLAKLRRGERDL